MRANLERRLVPLESSGLVISSLADYVLWHAQGCDPVAYWEPQFKAQLEEFVKKSKMDAETCISHC